MPIIDYLELVSLARYTNSIEDIFNASPFDPNYDIGKKLTPDIFYKYFFVNSIELQKVDDKLIKMLESAVVPARVVFLSGFAGNGKTTFIRTFIKNHEEYHNVYIDFQEKRASYISGRGKEGIDNNYEVISMLNRAIKSGFSNGVKKKEEELVSTFQLLFDYRQILKDGDFITTSFYHSLCQYDGNNPLERTQISETMDQFALKDTFTCFFIHLFLQTHPKEKCIIYFDNLDITAIYYLATVFLEHFQDSLLDAVYLSRIEPFQNSGIDFKRQFRFIFCLRDVNDVEIHQHLSTRVGLQRLSFGLSFSPNYYQEIFKQRIAILEKLRFEKQVLDDDFSLTEYIKTCSDFVTDEYFKDVFIPLYNFDYRRISSTLINSVKNYHLSGEINRRYGMRGGAPF
jgi:hypothetical protein